MSPDVLQIIVLVVAGAALVIVPLSVVLLTGRIRTAAQESTQAALRDASQRHQQELNEFRQQYDRSLTELSDLHERSLMELTRQHERTMSEYARQHQRALAELGSEHMRIAQEFGMFSRKRHQVYAQLYARYRRATHDFTVALTGQEPEFQKFTRDDLLRYLQGRNIREREAHDALAAMDRGDLFAMGKLMTRLHWRTTLRDANTAFERAHEYESLNELYLTDPVRDAVNNVRRIFESLSYLLSREQSLAEQTQRIAKQDELHSAVASLLHAMRNDLRSGGEARASRARAAELDRTPARPALPSRAEPHFADTVPAAQN